MNMLVAVDRRAWQPLLASGASRGWLAAWLAQAGVAHTRFVELTAQTGRERADGLCVIAERAQLVRLARALGVAQSGAWHGAWHVCWRHDLPVLLLEPQAVVSERSQWLQPLAQGAPLAALPVCLGDGGEQLEAGLCVGAGPCLNHHGMLPEEQLLVALRERGWMLMTAESCTAGGIAARIARVPGASSVLAGGLVTYSNDMKQALLGVPRALLEQHGAVSRPVVEAMVRGGCRYAELCVAVSGIAGPGGGSAAKPVGTVWMAVGMRGRSILSRCQRFPGGRAEVQARTAVHALALTLEYLAGKPFLSL